MSGSQRDHPPSHGPAGAGRYGHRRITALLHAAGWVVYQKRVERIWRREGLKVPQRQPKRGRLWLKTNPASVFLTDDSGIGNPMHRRRWIAISSPGWMPSSAASSTARFLADLSSLKRMRSSALSAITTTVGASFRQPTSNSSEDPMRVDRGQRCVRVGSLKSLWRQSCS